MNFTQKEAGVNMGSTDKDNTVYLSSSPEKTPTTFTVYSYDATNDYNDSVKVNTIEAEVNKQTQQVWKVPMGSSVSMASDYGSGASKRFSTSYEMGKTVGSFVVNPGDRIGTVLNSSANAGVSHNLDVSRVSSSITPSSLNIGGYNYTAWGEWNGNGGRYTDIRANLSTIPLIKHG